MGKVRGGKPRSLSDGRLKANRDAKRVAEGKEPAPKRTNRKSVVVSINPRMQDFLDGKITVADLDDDEIKKGKFKGPNGKFGPTPALVPAKFHVAMVNEFRKRMEKKFAKDSEMARRVLRELATNPRTHADARYKAAALLLERGLGKVVEKQEMTVEVKKWENVLGDVVLSYDEDEASNDSDRTDNKNGPFG